MKQGFTLLELLIVMVIIGILAIIAIPKYLDAVETAHQTAIVSNLKECREAGLMYQSFYNGTPATTIGAGATIDIDINGDGEFEKQYINSSGTAVICTGWTDASTCTQTKDGYSAVISVGSGDITWN